MSEGSIQNQEHRHLRAGECGYSSSSREHVHPSPAFVLFSPSAGGMVPSSLGRVISFTQSTHSDVTPSQKHPQITLYSSWAHIKLTITLVKQTLCYRTRAIEQGGSGPVNFKCHSQQAGCFICSLTDQPHFRFILFAHAFSLIIGFLLYGKACSSVCCLGSVEPRGTPKT